MDTRAEREVLAPVIRRALDRNATKGWLRGLPRERDALAESLAASVVAEYQILPRGHEGCD